MLMPFERRNMNTLKNVMAFAIWSAVICGRTVCNRKAMEDLPKFHEIDSTIIYNSCRKPGVWEWIKNCTFHTPFYLTTIFCLFFSFFPHSETCQSVSPCEWWGLSSENSVIKKQSWFDGGPTYRPQINGWVANRWSRQTLAPVYNVQSQMSFTSWVIIRLHKHFNDKIKVWFDGQYRCLAAFQHRLQYHLKPFAFFSLCVIYGVTLGQTFYSCSGQFWNNIPL